MAHQSYQSRIPRRAFDDTMSLLGDMGKVALLAELESKKVYSSKRDYLDADEIAQSLELYFGPVSTRLIMDEVRVKANNRRGPASATR